MLVELMAFTIKDQTVEFQPKMGFGGKNLDRVIL